MSLLDLLPTRQPRRRRVPRQGSPATCRTPGCLREGLEMLDTLGLCPSCGRPLAAAVSGSTSSTSSTSSVLPSSTSALRELPLGVGLAAGAGEPTPAPHWYCEPCGLVSRDCRTEGEADRLAAEHEALHHGGPPPWASTPQPRTSTTPHTSHRPARRKHGRLRRPELESGSGLASGGDYE